MKLHAILGRFGIWGRPLSFETFEDSEPWNFKLLPRQQFETFGVWARQPTTFGPRGTLGLAHGERTVSARGLLVALQNVGRAAKVSWMEPSSPGIGLWKGRW